MSTEDRVIGPFRIQALVAVTDGNGTTGEACFTFKPGRVVTREDVIHAMKSSLEAVGSDFRLMNASEFFNDVIVKEKIGQSGDFATPHWADFDVDALTKEIKEST